MTFTTSIMGGYSPDPLAAYSRRRCVQYWLSVFFIRLLENAMGKKRKWWDNFLRNVWRSLIRRTVEISTFQSFEVSKDSSELDSKNLLQGIYDWIWNRVAFTGKLTWRETGLKTSLPRKLTKGQTTDTADKPTSHVTGRPCLRLLEGEAAARVVSVLKSSTVSKRPVTETFYTENEVVG